VALYNIQLTLKPSEKKIISDFELSKFIVCTDAGLASEENRNQAYGGWWTFSTL